jgi:CubicO group peptidase (beta-lactamase class C family)
MTPLPKDTTTPRPRSVTTSTLTALERVVDALVDSGTASAAVALIGGPRRVEWSRAAGWARGAPPAGRPAEVGTWFDLASLTKPFVATLALALDRSRELPLATPLGEVLAGAHPRLAATPLGDLLRHRAGLPAWTPLYARCHSLAEVEALLLAGVPPGAGGPPEGRRRGAPVYSDLDYLLWGIAAERALGRPLAALVAERVLAPLDPSSLTAVMPGDLPQVAASRMGGGREVEIGRRQGFNLEALPPPPPGLPQDGNARFLASLATGGGRPLFGHAGLFGPAGALWRLGAEWLEPRIVLQKETVDAALAGSGPFALGWWRRRHRGGGGPALSPGSYGHTGFAGGNLWIDPARSLVFVLLAYRTEPASDMNRWRRRFHAAAVRAFPAPPARP